MQYITTTDLRTKTSQLVSALKKGDSISLIHRSKVIGEVKPKRQAKPLTEADIAELKRLARKLNLPKLSYKEREERYRKHIIEKYGQNLS